MKLSSAGPKVDGGEQTEREVNIFTCPVASHAIARSQIFLGVLFSYGKKKSHYGSDIPATEPGLLTWYFPLLDILDIGITLIECL